MDKREVTQISMELTEGGQCSLQLELNRSGIWMRRGTAKVPEVRIGAIGTGSHPQLFQQMLALLPHKVSTRSSVYGEPEAMYRSWLLRLTSPGTESVLHFRLGRHSTYRDPMLHFLESYVQHALEKTNAWYFDALVLAVYRLRAPGMSDVRLMLPDERVQVQSAFEHYINQMCYGRQALRLADLARGKTYFDAAGKPLEARIWQHEQGVFLRFVPPGTNDTTLRPDGPALPAGLQPQHLSVWEETEKAPVPKGEVLPEAPVTRARRPWWKFW